MASFRILGAGALRRALGGAMAPKIRWGSIFDRRWNLRAVFLRNWHILRWIGDDLDDPFALRTLVKDDVPRDDDRPIFLPEHPVHLGVRLIPHEHSALAHRLQLASPRLRHVCVSARTPNTLMCPTLGVLPKNASHGVFPCAPTGVRFRM